MRTWSDEDMYEMAKSAFDAGWDFGYLCGKQGDWDELDFKEWWSINGFDKR